MHYNKLKQNMLKYLKKKQITKELLNTETNNFTKKYESLV